MKKLTVITGVILMVVLALGNSSCGKKEEPQAEGKININTASAEELQRVPGVDQTLAQNIVAYRNMNGAYASADDLGRVQGMDQNKLDSIKDYVTVEGSSGSRQEPSQSPPQQSPQGSQPSQEPGQQGSSN